MVFVTCINRSVLTRLFLNIGQYPLAILSAFSFSYTSFFPSFFCPILISSFPFSPAFLPFFFLPFFPFPCLHPHSFFPLLYLFCFLFHSLFSSPFCCFSFLSFLHLLFSWLLPPFPSSIILMIMLFFSFLLFNHFFSFSYYFTSLPSGLL